MIVWPAFLSLGGFTEDAKAFCLAQGIGIADKLVTIDPELMKEA